MWIHSEIILKIQEVHYLYYIIMEDIFSEDLIYIKFGMCVYKMCISSVITKEI